MATLLKYKKGLKRPTLAWNEMSFVTMLLLFVLTCCWENPIRENTIISRNIRAIDMHGVTTDIHTLLVSGTQSNSTDPLGVYNICIHELLDRHAPLVTCTVTDRTSAPWMTLKIKQAKVQRRLAERKWRESGLTVYREMYVKHRNLVSNMISKAKKEYFCHKIVQTVLGNFSASIVRWWANWEILCFPQIFPLSLFLISFVNSLYIRLKRPEAALTLTDQSPRTLLNSLAQSL